MSQHTRGFRGRTTVSKDSRPSDLPENIGNRRTFEELRIPPDNVGNRVDYDPIATFIHDGLGNSLDGEPAHLKSGVLTHLMAGFREKSAIRKQANPKDFSEKNSHTPRTYKTNPTEKLPAQNPDLMHGDDYMLGLVEEFSKLLSKKEGLPFAFSMKSITDHAINEQEQSKNMHMVQKLIERILGATAINAAISFVQYHSVQHRFAVFFINPQERDPTKNKELISALRQVIKLHTAKFFPAHINLLLVLANAQSVIEAHLTKMGAQKI